MLTMGSAESTPTTAPPISAGWVKRELVVIFTAKMGDQLLTLEVAERILQLHQLDEEIVFRIEAGGVNRTLEVERQPLLNPVHAGPLGKVHEQRHVEHDWRGKDAVAAEKIDLQLHLVAEPADQVDVIPALLVVAARRVIVDPHDVTEMLVQIGVQL